VHPADLVILVADASMKAAIEGLLSRPAALGISPVSRQVLIHPNRDPGCRLQSHELLRALQRQFRYALVLFDLQGSGAVGKDRATVEAEVEARLNAAGWKDRSAAIAIAPELETWIWTDSPQVDRILGWQARTPDLRSWLVSQGIHFDLAGKPANPKEAVEKALRHVRKPRSSVLYRELAEKVPFDHCQDPSFRKLRSCLAAWFGHRR